MKKKSHLPVTIKKMKRLYLVRLSYLSKTNLSKQPQFLEKRKNFPNNQCKTSNNILMLTSKICIKDPLLTQCLLLKLKIRKSSIVCLNNLILNFSQIAVKKRFLFQATISLMILHLKKNFIVSLREKN